MDFGFVILRFRTSLAVNAKDCLNSNLQVELLLSKNKSSICSNTIILGYIFFIKYETAHKVQWTLLLDGPKRQRSPTTSSGCRFWEDRSGTQTIRTSERGGAPKTKRQYLFLILSFCFLSTRRDSNPRPSPWQGDTPPLSHSCICYLIVSYVLTTK